MIHSNPTEAQVQADAAVILAGVQRVELICDSVLF
jgi:hypothetical protein